MTLNDYITQSYQRPNKAVLKSLGANDGLIDYLMDTPWNTNWNVVGSIQGEGGSEDWTTIRLKPVEFQPGIQILGSTDEHDIALFFNLCELYDNNQHPAIKINGVGKDFNKNIRIITNGLGLILTDSYMGHLILINCDTQNESSMIAYVTQELGAPTNMIMSYIIADEETDYLDISYKANKQNYILTFYDPNYPDESIDCFVSPKQQWLIHISDLDRKGECFTDGINNYYEGDTITFNNDMALTRINNLNATFTIRWLNGNPVPDMTNIKFGDSVIAPYYGSSYYWAASGVTFVSAEGTDEERTFEFTKEYSRYAQIVDGVRLITFDLRKYS